MALNVHNVGKRIVCLSVPETVKQTVGMYKIMPDLRLTIEDMIDEGDKVAITYSSDQALQQ